MEMPNYFGRRVTYADLVQGHRAVIETFEKHPALTYEYGDRFPVLTDYPIEVQSMVSQFRRMKMRADNRAVRRFEKKFGLYHPEKEK